MIKFEKKQSADNPVLSLAFIWLWIWLGHNSDSWVRTALMATLSYAIVRLIFDVSTNRKKENPHV